MRLFNRKSKQRAESPDRLFEEDCSSINDSSLFTDADRSFWNRNSDQCDTMSMSTKKTTISQEFDRRRRRSRHNVSPSKARTNILQSSEAGPTKPEIVSPTHDGVRISTPSTDHSSLRQSPIISIISERHSNVELEESFLVTKRNRMNKPGPAKVALQEGYRPSLSIEDRILQLNLRAPSRSEEPKFLWQDEIPSPYTRRGQVQTGDDDSFPLQNSIDSDDERSMCPKDKQGSLTDSVDEDLGSILKYDDSNLMRTGSPGALRLTPEGLEKHQKKLFLDDCSVSLDEKEAYGFEVWKTQQQRRTYMMKKMEERDNKLEHRVQEGLSDSFVTLFPEETDFLVETKTLKNGKIQKTIRRPPPMKMTALQKLGLVSCAEMKLQKSQMAAISLVAMNSLTDDDMLVSSSKKLSLKLTSLRKKSKKLTKEQFLMNERKKQMLAEQQKEEEELKEKIRIADMRSEYIKKQRALESMPSQNGSSKSNVVIARSPQRPVNLWHNVGGNVECVSETGTNEKAEIGKPSKVEIVETDVSTVSTDRSSLTCVICGSGRRTHIALPCMHCAYCEECVVRMSDNGITACQVCHMSAAFSRVFV